MKRLAVLTALAACGLSVFSAGTALAAGPECTYVALARTLTIVTQDSTPASNRVSISLNSGNIEVRDATNTLLACMNQAQPPLSNVDAISMDDNAPGPHDSIFTISERTGTFTGGGPTDEGTGAQEVEIQYDGRDGTDQLQLDGTDNADVWLFGEAANGDIGANLNGDDDGDDILAKGVEKADITGGKGDDSLSAIGNAAIPAIAGPLQLDELILQGGNQNDTIRGGAGNDKILGGTQDDDLDGGGGTDTVDGGDNDDILDGGAQADVLTGGTGSDFATYATATGGVNISLDGAANDGGAPDNFADNVLPDIEKAAGGAGPDNIVGSILDNELTGNAGNDTVDGGAGNDKVAGSAGIDRLLGGLGNDTIFGGTENDNMVGAAGNDVLTGNAGKDIFLGKKGLDRLNAADGAKDKKIDCGPGANKREKVKRDRKDPKPKSC